MTDATIQDFLAHTMYLTDCRNRGMHGVAWACMDESQRRFWLACAAGAFASWLETEANLKRARDAGNAKGFFFP